MENTLESIAYQNPIYGGMSVYGARVMLNLDITDNYEEPEERVGSMNSVQNKRMDNIGHIIPNPNSGEMKYILGISPQSKGLLEIYDLIGNLVKTVLIHPEVKEIEINLSGFSEGVYMYKISLDDSIQDIGKIILQK